MPKKFQKSRSTQDFGIIDNRSWDEQEQERRDWEASDRQLARMRSILDGTNPPYNGW